MPKYKGYDSKVRAGGGQVYGPMGKVAPSPFSQAAKYLEAAGHDALKEQEQNDRIHAETVRVNATNELRVLETELAERAEKGDYGTILDDYKEAYEEKRAQVLDSISDKNLRQQVENSLSQSTTTSVLRLKSVQTSARNRAAMESYENSRMTNKDKAVMADSLGQAFADIGDTIKSGTALERSGLLKRGSAERDFIQLKKEVISDRLQNLSAKGEFDKMMQELDSDDVKGVFDTPDEYNELKSKALVMASQDKEAIELNERLSSIQAGSDLFFKTITGEATFSDVNKYVSENPNVSKEEKKALEVITKTAKAPKLTEAEKMEVRAKVSQNILTVMNSPEITIDHVNALKDSIMAGVSSGAYTAIQADALIKEHLSVNSKDFKDKIKTGAPKQGGFFGIGKSDPIMSFYNDSVRKKVDGGASKTQQEEQHAKNNEALVDLVFFYNEAVKSGKKSFPNKSEDEIKAEAVDVAKRDFLAKRIPSLRTMDVLPRYVRDADGDLIDTQSNSPSVGGTKVGSDTLVPMMLNGREVLHDVKNKRFLDPKTKEVIVSK